MFCGPESWSMVGVISKTDNVILLSASLNGQEGLMPSLDKASPLIDMDKQSPEDPESADSLFLAADEAEAEAAEAEALAAAARARAKAIRLRREAAEAEEADEAVADEVVELDDLELPAEPPDVDKPRDRSWMAVVAATLIVVLSLGLIGAGGWMAWQHRKVVAAQAQMDADQHRRAEFAAAAAQGVVNMMSLDYRRAKEDVQRIIDGTMGDFKKDFEATAADFIKVAEGSKSVTEATVTGTAVQAMTQDSAIVLVAATTKVSNAASKDQPPRSWRWSVEVARDGGQIKLAKVEIVP